MAILDTHYHWDFISSSRLRQQFADHLKNRGYGLVAQTVRPTDFDRILSEANQLPLTSRPLLSLGFHPWYIQDPDQVASEMAAFQKGLKATHLIGEVGLDYSPNRLKNVEMSIQKSVFKQLLQAVADQSTDSSPYLLSIHTVRSANDVLDIWTELGLADSSMIPILHRFNGTSDELTRHLRLGGYISVHPQMFNSKKGRAYLQQIPLDRLLLESDLPEGQTDQDLASLVDSIICSLTSTLQTLVEVRGQEVIYHLMANQERLYNFPSRMKDI